MVMTTWGLCDRVLEISGFLTTTIPSLSAEQITNPVGDRQVELAVLSLPFRASLEVDFPRGLAGLCGLALSCALYRYKVHHM